MNDIFKKALLGQACGDSFGSPFEYNPKAPALSRLSLHEKRYLSWEESGQQPERARLAGLYTDDTQQALLLAYAYETERNHRLILDDVLGVIGSDIFLSFCREMRDVAIQDAPYGSHRGTGRNFRHAIDTGKPQTTAGLGAAMRVGPVATLFDDPQEMIDWVLHMSAHTTNDPVGLAVAARYAFLVWAVAYPDAPHREAARRVVWPTKDIPNNVWEATHKALRIMSDEGEEALLDYGRKTGWSNKPLTCAAGGFGLTGMAWSVVHGLKAKSFEAAMQGVCSSGGDTDTVAAMTGCIAALRHPVPQWMIDGLDDCVRGMVLNPNSWRPWFEDGATRKEIQLRQGATAQQHQTIPVDFFDMSQTVPCILFGNKNCDPTWRVFSNFWLASFDLDGRKWPSVEHYYQAMKVGDEAFIQKILKEPSPAGTKRLGRNCHMRSDWDVVKYNYMWKAVYAKFSQNESLKKLLLSTADAVLHEDRPDPYWGGGPNYPGGRDWLGHILMGVRNQLRVQK